MFQVFKSIVYCYSSKGVFLSVHKKHFCWKEENAIMAFERLVFYYFSTLVSYVIITIYYSVKIHSKKILKKDKTV